VAPWTNQDLVLFHGTLNIHVLAILAGVNVSLGRPNTDFGQGFYTTTSLLQAKAWAWQLAVRRPGTLPAVIQLTVGRDALAGLDSVWFVRGGWDADDFWSLVHHCRSTGGNHARAVKTGWYDVAVGPVAASWRQRLSIFDADQISFHTLAAQAVLNASPRVVVP
jgi:hypothetical protein